MSQMIYHLVGHEIQNKTLYFVKRYYSQILRYLRKCMKKFNITPSYYSVQFHVYPLLIAPSIIDNLIIYLSNNTPEQTQYP